MMQTTLNCKGWKLALALAFTLLLTVNGLGQAKPAVETTAAPALVPDNAPPQELTPTSTALPQTTIIAAETKPPEIQQAGQPVVVVRPPADELRDIMLGSLFILIIGVVLFVLLRRLRT